MSYAPTPYDSGRTAAFAVYVLYLLSIPSAAVFALIGVIVAFASLGNASGVAAAHLADQIRVWWIAFWWGVMLAVAAVISAVLTIVLIGFPLLWLVGVLAFIVMIWFTVKGVLGLVALLNNAPP
jgi:uncharacterized membrane protein